MMRQILFEAKVHSSLHGAAFGTMHRAFTHWSAAARLPPSHHAAEQARAEARHAQAVAETMVQESFSSRRELVKQRDEALAIAARADRRASAAEAKAHARVTALSQRTASAVNAANAAGAAAEEASARLLAGGGGVARSLRAAQAAADAADAARDAAAREAAKRVATAEGETKKNEKPKAISWHTSPKKQTVMSRKNGVWPMGRMGRGGGGGLFYGKVTSHLPMLRAPALCAHSRLRFAFCLHVP